MKSGQHYRVIKEWDQQHQENLPKEASQRLKRTFPSKRTIDKITRSLSPKSADTHCLQPLIFPYGSFSIGIIITFK